MTPVRESRGYRLLFSNPITWTTAAMLGVIGGLCLAGTPVGSIQHTVVVVVWGYFVVSLALIARTWVAVDGRTVHVRGRLRRRTIDTTDVDRFAANPNGDAWHFLVFLTMPLVGTFLWTVSALRTDGSVQDIRSVVGSAKVSARLAKEINRQLGL